MWAEKIHLNLSTSSEPVITLYLNKGGNGHFPGDSQWLRLQATTAGGTRSTHGQGTSLVTQW